SYLSGITPNPCVICNQQVKIAALLSLAGEWGFDAVATGHYAVTADFNGVRLLSCARNAAKSQEYFLCFLKPSDLLRCIFPVGEAGKSDTRCIAREAELPVAEKKDSQDICFIPKNKELWEVFPDRMPIKPGCIVDQSGKAVGEHKGFYFYTIGQRKGLNLNLGVPYFVTGIDPEKNLLIVGEESFLYTQVFRVGELNVFYAGFASLDLSVKVRFSSRTLPCKVRVTDSEAIVMLSEPARAVTPGQIACFYHQEFVVAAGVILAEGFQQKQGIQ
ncbi:MAG: tRNA 2-thiouridine(34) synthase MnmA, partial [Candidatus Wallbacteria bacterium]|nr:tRNA 2-thiouridine(34) synthase MnmA [Candidatus Wallbacteria bacterium]